MPAASFAGAALILSLLAVSVAEAQPQRPPRDFNIVFFSAPSCSHCLPVYRVLSDFVREHRQRANLAGFNVEASPEEARRYGIDRMPMVVVFSRNGQVLFRVAGGDPTTVRNLQISLNSLIRSPKRGDYP